VISRFYFDVAVARVTSELRQRQPLFDSPAAFGMCEMVNRHLFGPRTPNERDEDYIAAVEAEAVKPHDCPAAEVLSKGE